MFKVTCILTSYNRPVGVQEAIVSVQAQTYPNWELIIVDDNSDSLTQSILKDIVSKDQRCKLIQSGVKEEDRFKTTRYAACINMAIPYITGDLVTYLTDDDIYYPQRFEKMVELFKNNTIHVVYGRQKVVTLTNGVPTNFYIRPLVGITRSPENYVDHNSFMHRRSCLDITQGWDVNPDLWTHGDIGFFRRLVRYWDFYPLDFVTDEHRLHENGIGLLMARGEKPWKKGMDPRFALASELHNLVDRIVESPSDVIGWLDVVKVEETQITVSGWARDLFTGKPAQEVVIVNQGNNILAYAKVTQPREDIAAHFNNRRMLHSGWSVTFKRNLLPTGDHSLLAYVLKRKDRKAIRLLGEFNLVN
ncbi:glycosyltransferase family 2 protein [Neobacillus mesonae]|uniref:glycosyltransferase family 2 protein n=1 Tax=Neobacillus mesonae TaxID=1193713 RepID=UPI00204083BA|nr:glycosyltransferase family 2 protein [Neobacillus mesonae]MCM3571051.1 glycosyltransferase [Neobacillus mesonae]